MDASNLISRFDELNRDGGMLRKSFLLLAEISPAKAAEFLECYEGVETYNNYLSENEAKSIVRNFINYDKSTGAKWSPDELFEAVEEMGGYTENKPHYNKWALYAVMNMVHSDHGRVIGKWVDGDDAKYAEFCYDLTISQLTDTDRPRFVRGYFGLD